MATVLPESNALAKSRSLYLATTQREKGEVGGWAREEMDCFCVGVIAMISDAMLHCACAHRPPLH